MLNTNCATIIKNLSGNALYETSNHFKFLFSYFAFYLRLWFVLKYPLHFSDSNSIMSVVLF